MPSRKKLSSEASQKERAMHWARAAAKFSLGQSLSFRPLQSLKYKYNTENFCSEITAIL